MNEYLADWNDLKQYLIALALGIAAATVLLFVKRFAWSRFIRWTRSSESPLEEIVLNQLRPPLNAILLLIAFSFGLQLTPPELRSHPAVPVATKLLLVLALLWMIHRALTVIMEFWRPIKTMGANTRILVLTVSRAVLYALTLLIILDVLGVSITPLLASLGVGSVAVALAAQDTLSNFFSGIYILLDKPIQPGDFIKLEGGVMEGFVRKIGWRSSQIETSSGDMIVLPNSRLSSSILTNFNFPTQQTAVATTVGVAYDSDLQFVEKIVLEVGTDILHRTPGAVPDFVPTVRFHTFGPSSIDLDVKLRAKSHADVAFVKSEFMKALHARFAKEKIEIPFPQQVVHDAR